MAYGVATPTWVAAFTTAALVAGVGGAATRIGPWYRSLRKPSWQPPDWLFGPVWTVVFACAAVSGALAWTYVPAGDRLLVLLAYLLNGVLNVAWSVLFFTLRRPDWAFVEVFALLGSVAGLIVLVRPASAAAAWFLVPYLVWVSFASVLNRAVVVRNRPFGTG